MNQAKENINITGAIVQADDGVLLNNRLDKKIPIIDEVAMIEKVPLGMTCAIEVAQQGSILSTLSNPIWNCNSISFEFRGDKESCSDCTFFNRSTFRCSN